MALCLWCQISLMWKQWRFYLRVLCFSEGSRTPRPHGPPPRCCPRIVIAKINLDMKDRSHHCRGHRASSPRCSLVQRLTGYRETGIMFAPSFPHSTSFRSGPPPLTSCPGSSEYTGVILTAKTSSRCSSSSPVSFTLRDTWLMPSVPFAVFC